jgi:hypothetical protein
LKTLLHHSIWVNLILINQVTASDVVCYSFDFTKFPGCLGSGGGLATRNAELSDRIYELQAHGTDRNKQVVGIGTKSFMDNTSCAVLLKEFEFLNKISIESVEDRLLLGIIIIFLINLYQEKIIFGKGIQCLFLQVKLWMF